MYYLEVIVNVKMRDYNIKICKRNYVNYTTETLNETLEKIANGELTIRKASAQYSIPYGRYTLFYTTYRY